MALLQTLVDAFNTTDTAKWDFAAGASVTGGRLVTSATSTQYITWTDVTYDLTGSYIFLEVPQVPSPAAADVETTLSLTQGSLFGPNAFYIWCNNGILYFYDDISNTETESHVTYDAVAHRWWRIKESGGTIFWDTSPDGVTWTNRRNKAAGITITALWVGIECYAGSGSPSALMVDNVNNPPNQAFFF